MGNRLEPIINEAGLKADMIKDLASFLKVAHATTLKYLTQEEVERRITRMLETENEIILGIMRDIIKEKQNV